MRKTVGILLFVLLLPAFISNVGIGSGSLGLTPEHGEPKIFGRIAESRSSGLFSHAMLTGWCGGLANQYVQAFQLKAFGDGACTDYTTYNSQSGLQAAIFSVIIAAHASEWLLRLITAAFLALALVLFCLWLYDEFGSTVAFVTAFGVLALRGLVLVGDNIAHVFGIYFLILACTCFAYEKKSAHIGSIVCCLMLFKYPLTGFEYVTAAWMMAFAPLAFYAVRDKFEAKQFRQHARKIGSAIAVATFVAIAILTVQISVVSSPKEAVSHLTERLQARTQFPTEGNRSVYYESMKISTPALLKQYLSFDAIRVSNIRISFGMLTIFFVLITAGACLVYRKNRDRKLVSLAVMLWASVLVPLTWPLMFKGHAAFHTFIDPVIWHMPFTILGIALTAATVRAALKLRANP
ncbi:MAG TPA: hypothetical protein VGE35_03730 [Candidatus Paceibacterota bacterium]